MARRRRSSRTGRDHNTIATTLVVPRVRALPVSPVFVPVAPRPRLRFPTSTFEDRRQWHPERAARPALSSPRSAARLVARGHVRDQTKAIVAFAAPDRVAVCVRRRRRREVLFARGVGGRRGLRSPRRSFYSGISCRRR